MRISEFGIRIANLKRVRSADLEFGVRSLECGVWRCRGPATGYRKPTGLSHLEDDSRPASTLSARLDALGPHGNARVWLVDQLQIQELLQDTSEEAGGAV